MASHLHPDLTGIPQSTSAAQNVLVLGSAPDAARAKSWNLEQFDAVVAINNAWRVGPDWTHSIFPSDFAPEKRPLPQDHQSLHSAEAYVPIQNRFGGFVYAGGTMAYTAAYWSLGYLQPKRIAFLGCDMVYDGDQTHFYGRGSPDPLRKDPTLRNLEAKAARFEAIAFRLGCEVFNLSTKPESRLTYRRANLDNFPGFDPARFEKAAVERALSFEQELGYFVESGKYWKEQDRFDIGLIDRLDRMWLECLTENRE